ncbi:MAG: hypothetical protein IPL95_10470 [Saprospiraceae bacterium]|nr:hypothetical protein [Saprospiraceae bacterium]
MRYFIFVLLLFSNNLSAQKNDYIWITGDVGEDTVFLDWGGTEINFNSNPIGIKKRILPFGMFANTSSYCDGQGNLLFYTNGYAICNRLDSIMENGDSLDINTYNLDNLYFGNDNWFGSIFLPFKDKLYLFNTDRKKDDKGIAWPSIINYNVIDIKANNNLGKVLVKNKVLFDGEVNNIKTYITACQHGNGIDWWVIGLYESNNKIIQYLIKEDTIIGPNFFELDVKFDKSKVFNLGGLFFSQDGSKLIYGSLMRNIFIQDFDRCTGAISNSKTIETNYLDNSFGGLMVSPSGRFVYASDFSNLYQYDLWSSDISASKVFIDSLDKSKQYPFEGKFMKMQLGPDGKIYMNCFNSVRVMHRINNPDEKGKACNFVQNDVFLATDNKISIPNFPNYRLGPLKGSPCDTILGVANKDLSPDNYQIKLFPNPANDQIKVDITLKEYDPTIKTEVVIVDVSGAIVQKYTMPDFAYLAQSIFQNWQVEFMGYN